MTNYFLKSPQKPEKPYSPIRAGPGSNIYGLSGFGPGQPELTPLDIIITNSSYHS